MNPIAAGAVESLPIAVPTDFIVGSAGLGSVIAFVLGFVVRFRGSHAVDPLRYAGYGAGLVGAWATAT
jgi:hypothetical protein